MLGELAEVGRIFLDFVKDRRLDVRDDQAIEVVEQAAFNNVARQGQTLRVRQRAGIFMPEHAGQQHFMGLLVDFQQFRGAQLVVPAQQVCAGKDQLQQALANDRHTVSSTRDARGGGACPARAGGLKK